MLCTKSLLGDVTATSTLRVGEVLQGGADPVFPKLTGMSIQSLSFSELILANSILKNGLKAGWEL